MPIPFSNRDYPNAHALVSELHEGGVINLVAFERPNPLSENCIRNLDERVLSRLDFVRLMRAREDEFKREDYNAARRAEMLEAKS